MATFLVTRIQTAEIPMEVDGDVEVVREEAATTYVREGADPVGGWTTQDVSVELLELHPELDGPQPPRLRLL